MSNTTLLAGLSRVLNCPKVHVAATGLVTTYFAVKFVTGDLPPTQRASLWVAFIGAVAVQLREIINAWTEEDVAAVSAGKGKTQAGTPGDTGNGRPGVTETRTQKDAQAARISAVSLATDPAVLQSTNSISQTRSIDMPARTKLPAILIAFTSVALLAATGCQTSPELTTYREGLHQVDEPLYQAHLLLLDDAVKANIRTPADQQVVQQGIAAAEALYQQSRATEAALPTTSPTAP